MRATFEVECVVCQRVDTVTREKQPNERLPDFEVPAGWVETKQGLFCPEHADVA